MLTATASNTFIIGPIAKLFGMIMNWIYNIGITNVGVCILLLAFIVYMLTLPLTIKQQKFSRMSAIMNPEIQAIQKKYKGKKDQESMSRMQLETREVYDKYGSSPTTGCLPLLIQLPILWALYRIIYNVPAYVKGIYDIYVDSGLVDKIKEIPADQFIQFGKDLKVNIDEVTNNTIVDVLWKLQDASWIKLQELGNGIAGFADSVAETIKNLEPHITFLGIKISEAPLSMLKAAWTDKSFLMILVALLIPILAGVTQWLNVKLMPQQTPPTGGDDQAAQMAGTMKTMNTLMPLMSVFFCFTLPAAIGIYWVFGAVFRGIQQFIINKSLKNMDIEKEIEKNKAKAERKKKRQGVYSTDANARAKATTNTKKIASTSTSNKPSPTTTRNAKPGSLASKANMVRDYNEKNK